MAALREMDPPGVGAADLRDSLLIQLEQRGLKPVSYTHLDVYKRQGLRILQPPLFILKVIL